MTKEPTLVIMAAGMGSRYGGLKQVDKITEAGEILLDFSLYDAMMAGFDRVIFVIREEHRDLFRELVDERAGRFINVEYAYQDLNDIPEGFEVPEGREKPWGTGHAILACRDLIDGPFAVINADDYYGAGAFVTIYDYLTSHSDGDKYSYCMVAYELKNTITENGHVTRGVCETDDKGYLCGITERMKIMRKEEGIAYEEDDGSWVVLDENTPVSMNFWGFTASLIDELKKDAERFFAEDVSKNPLKSEFLLPMSVDALIKEGKAQVEVLNSSDKWCGVTYREDKETVTNSLQAKKDRGEYPEKLWK
ncbi:MAG: sugar phosphate nucleotidyltransferase [Firmicutes bacterium]|nr:sugar phosphate nucleotidyltransferase [Bacillota bacterium]